MDSRTPRRAAFWTGVFAVLCALGAAHSAAAAQPPQQSQPAAGAASAVKQALGTVQAIDGRTITLAPLAPNSGSPTTVKIHDEAHILRIEPGETDLKKAVPMELSDLQVGDRVRVRGPASSDAVWVATEVLAIKHADLAAKNQATMDDWRKTGIGGLVHAVDAATGAVDISMVSGAGAKTVAIQTDKNTAILRYAPDSVDIANAKPAVLDQIKPGDQLQARGPHSADGSSVAAEEIVFGSFRNISGTIDSIDPGDHTLTVRDLVTKRPVVVDIGAQSLLRKLPAPMAMAVAARLKAASQPQTSGAPAAPGRGGASGAAGGAGGPGAGRAAQTDFQQVVNRSPAVMLADLQKGDAVMIVGAPNENSTGVTAIMLVGGVEPILTAPNGGQGMTLAPWSLGGPDAEAGP